VDRFPLAEEPAVSYTYSHLSLLPDAYGEPEVDVFTTDQWGTPVADAWDVQPVEQWENPAPAERWDVTHAEAWRQDALCAETDPEAFFPDKGGSTREAKLVCRGCSVRGECLEYALANEERFGIWGGLSERERRRVRLQRREPLSA
jgi:WhiB family transcriptional regulator, redox-sensing transcriptional regulator